MRTHIRFVLAAILFVNASAASVNLVAGIDLSTSKPFASIRVPSGNVNASIPLQLVDANGVLAGMDINDEEIVQYADMVCFVASSHMYGKEVYCQSPTSNGPFVVKDVKPGGDGITGVPHLFNFNNTWLMWVGTSTEEGREVWGWNGNDEAHLLFGDMKSGPSNSDFVS